MNTIAISKSAIAAQAAQNLVEAGVLKPEEYAGYVGVITETLSMEDAFKTLVGSNEIREKTGRLVNFYPIDWERIAVN